jgi:hypothetical protein
VGDCLETFSSRIILVIKSGLSIISLP